MKRILVSLALVFTALVSQAQVVPSDSGALRRMINETLIPNGNKQITASQMRAILIGITNLMKDYAIDSAYQTGDTLILTRRGGYTSIKVYNPGGGTGSEADPTVSLPAKSITQSNIDTWNGKQNAITPGTGVSLVANVLNITNGAAIWNADKIQGRVIENASPTVGQVLKWNGSAWAPAEDGGGSETIKATAPLSKSGSNVAMSFKSEGLKLKDSALDAKAKVFNSAASLRSLTAGDTGSVYRVRINREYGEFKYDPDDVTSADDSAMVLVSSGGQRFKRVIADVIYPEDFGAVGDGVTNDAPAFNKMFRWMEGSVKRNYDVKFKSRQYYLGSQVDLPKVLPTSGLFLTQPRVLIDFTGVEVTTDYPGYLFYRMPSSSSESTSYLGNYKLEVRGGNFHGSSTVGSVAFKIGSTYGTIIERSHFYRFDTALVMNFSLNGKVRDCYFTQSLYADIIGASNLGYYSGATIATTAFNANTIEGCRFFSRSTAFTTVMLLGADQTTVFNCITEGQKPRYNFYYDDQGNTGVLQNKFEKIWIESSTGPTNTNFYLKFRGQMELKDIQRIYPDTLFSLVPTATSRIYLRNIPYLSNLPSKAFKTSSNSTALFAEGLPIGGDLILLDTAYWDNNIIPATMDSKGYLSANGGPTYLTKGVMNFRPGYGTDIHPNNKIAQFEGHISFQTDNTYYLGGRVGNNRPKRISVGTDGLRVDKAATYGIGFGDNITNPTVYFKQFNDSTAQIVAPGGFTIPRGTTAQRVGNINAVTNPGWFRWNTETNKFEGRWSATASDWRNFASENFVQDSSLSLRTSIQKNLDSLFQHNLRIIKNSDSLAAHNARLIALRDSISNLRNSINSLPTGSSGTSSETLVTPNDADYTISTGTGNLTVVYFNTLTAERLVTLPDPATNTGRIFTLKHGGGGLFNLNLSVPIHENSTTTTSSIAPGVSIQFMSDATKFIKIR